MAQGRVEITYDVADAEGEDVEITLLASADSGHTYLANTDSVSGDVGYPVVPGTGKQVVWNYADTISNILSYQIKLVADDQFTINIQDIVDQVDTHRILQTLQHIVGIRHRNVNIAHLNVTKDAIAQHFTQLGLQTRQHSFTYQTYIAHNIIGRLPGQEDERSTYIIDAHFDGVAVSPGADDNASGIAGVLEAARILSQYNFAHTVKFIGFDLEEAGLVGSRAYVSQGGMPAYDDVKGVFNFEMIGYYSAQANSQQFPFGFNVLFPNAYAQSAADSFRGNFITNVANTNSIPIQQAYDSAAARYVPALKVVSVAVAGTGSIAPDLRRSDHASFWDEGYRALMLTDGANFRNPNYHTANDTLGSLNLNFMANVIKATIGAVCMEAGLKHSTSATAYISQGTGVGEPLSARQEVRVFPNPVAGVLTITTRLPAEKITIATLDGKVVAEYTNPKPSMQINTATWAHGAYLVQVYTGGSAPVVRHVVK